VCDGEDNCPNTFNPTQTDTDGDGAGDACEDNDNDGMPDVWEVQHGLNPFVNDASLDSDGDGYTNLEEYKAGTDPKDKNSRPGWKTMPWLTLLLDDDSDNDGMPDDWEKAHGLNPKVNDAGEDPDKDGLTNLQEYQNKTDPQAKDTDSDGMPDGWEVQYGLNPLVNDASLDKDGDGFSNLRECQRGTDPNDSGSRPSSGMPWLELLLLGDE
jgi:hypothetical protein